MAIIPSGMAASQRRLVNYQHPDHDTAADWRPPR